MSGGEGERALPPGWARVKIEDLASDAPNSMAIGPFGSNLRVRDYRDDGVRLVFVRDIRSERFEQIGCKCVSEEKAVELASHIVRGGDLLVTKMGDPPGDTAVFPRSHPNAIVTADCIKMTVSTASSSDFLMHWLRTMPIRTRLAEQTQGVAQQKISLERFRGLVVELPPLSEQRRIVAKLDELLAASRRAREALDAVPAMLDQYRRSVLAAAFRGELTSDWRRSASAGPGSPPPAWFCCTIGELAANVPGAMCIGPFGSNLKVADYRASGVPLVFVRHIRSRRFGDPADHHVSPQKAMELASHRVKGGDLLVTKMGDPPGDTAVYPRTLQEAIITADCIKMTPGPRTSAEFLSHWLVTPPVRERLLDEVRGVAQQKLSLERFRSLRVELPSLAEQEEIVRRVDAAFARIEAVRIHVAEQRAALDALDRAILDKAFRGELVPQDPNDEPAAVMLERLRAERAAQGDGKKSRGRRRARDAEA